MKYRTNFRISKPDTNGVYTCKYLEKFYDINLSKNIYSSVCKA